VNARPTLLITFAWLWFVLGIASGALLGLGFHRPDFAGGYDAWRRRLMRRGHIAFFGTGFLALAMGLTASSLSTIDAASPVFRGLGWAMVGGAVAMPAVCFLSAWRKPWRGCFFLPVLLLGGAVLGFTAMLLRAGCTDVCKPRAD
jgi:hypothetical protein